MLIRLLALVTLLVIVGKAVRLLFRVSRPRAEVSSASPLVQDPVCGLYIEPKAAQETLDWEGHRIYFCSPSCAQIFRTGKGAISSQPFERPRD
ncbi:MAG: YHS domain-containing protein [Nitrospirae bacterium]|nr:YHS domain-containing protein [Nitrospirota bacterium]